ncbi:MAG: FadR/GntR family transcriptional regulator, partial [Lautropia sp.]
MGLPLPREAEFFAAYGVSRPVLREALKALAAKGMIRARPRVGTVVLPRQQWNLLDPDVLRWSTRTGDFENLRQLTQVRLIVEPGAAELAAIEQDAERIRQLADAFERMVARVGETASYLEADRDFHLAILAASRNDYLISIGSLISTSLQSSLRITNPTPRLNRASLGSHENILRRIEAGDGPGAARASRIQLDA